jgi:hypothetical protein
MFIAYVVNGTRICDSLLGRQELTETLQKAYESVLQAD